MQNPVFDCGPAQAVDALCPAVINAKCVTYTGDALLCLGVDANDRLDSILGKINDTVCNIGGGIGTVSSFSAGNLSPLFTTGVLTASTTPALSFTLTNAAANSVFGNFTALSAAPTYNVASVDNRFLVRRSGVLTFGALLAADIPLTFNNGLTLTSGNVKLGGTLVNDTTLAGANFYFKLTSANLIVRGVSGVGTAIDDYADNQMFFHVKKGAFRAGVASSSQWIEATIGSYSTAFGANCIASGDYSMAWGTGNNLSSGVLSTTWGNNAVASGSRSTAWGQTCQATGYTSTAWGELTISGAHYATAFGRGTQTYSYAGTAVGQFNDNTLTANWAAFDASNRAFEVGIGTSDGARLNALTTLFNGNTGLGVLIPTATLHTKAGTIAAGTAPIKLTSGVNLTTAEAGAFEYNGINLFFTPSSAVRNNVLITASVNTVSPTSPNRTITVIINGTTYYLAAKTTND